MARAEFDILHADADCVAIAKPAGVPAIPGRDGEPSALERLAAQLGLPCAGAADPRLRVVHRIDRDTSGALLFALSRDAQRHLSEQFRGRTVAKEYLALVAGAPGADEGTIESPIGPHPTSPRRMIVTKTGRPALTLWRVEQRYRGLALLRVFPKTGKTHQIRVHLRSIGLPLAIDPLYNPAGPRALLLSAFKRGYRPAADHEERPLIERLTLHAERLRFLDRSGRPIDLVAPLPKDLRAAVQMLGKYARS